MRGGRKLKPINGNSVAYLAYKYTLLTTFLPLGKKVVFTSADKQTTIKRVSNLTSVINRCP